VLNHTALLLALLLAAGSATAADPERVEWSPDWPRVRSWEKLGLVPLGALSLVLAFGVQPPAEPRWRGGILFDDWLRGGLKGSTFSTQQTFGKLGDYLFFTSVPLPLIVDVGIVTLGVHGNSDVALQMLLIDLQALGMSGVVTLGAERLVGRQRPYASDCGADGQVRDSAGKPLYNHCHLPYDNESFFAGHPTTVTTMAGLTCAHHQHLPLYGGGVADLAPCLLMVGAAGLTGVSRIVADKHWASDVLVGWTVGALSGYVVPSLLHYGFTSHGSAAGALGNGTLVAAPIPLVYPGGAGLGIVGVL